MSEERELPQGWVPTTLGEVVLDFVGGGTPSTKNEAYFTGNIPWLSVKDMGTTFPKDSIDHISEEAVHNSSTNIIPADSVVIATRIAPGRAIKISFDAAINQDLKGLITSSSIEKMFLLYWFIFSVRLIENLSSGTTVKGIRLETLETIPLLLPPLAEQQRIVAAIEQHFSRLDAGVAALKRVQQLLKRYRAAVLKAAVEGKLTEDWRATHPATEPGRVLLQRILAERRARWEAEQRAKGKDPAKLQYEEPAAPDTANLPELPEGWVWASLDQLAEVNRGRFSIRPRNDPRYYDGKYPFIQIGDLPTKGSYVRSHSQTLNEVGFSVSRQFPAGTIVISIAASIGATGILTYPCCFPDSLVGAICFRETTGVFVEMALRVRRNELQAASYASGGQSNINLPILKRLVFAIPPYEEQQEIVAEVERRLSILSEMEVNISSNLKRAERLRQSILREAFAGRLVPQDPADEPASVLLERIQAEREKMKSNIPSSQVIKHSSKIKRPQIRSLYVTLQKNGGQLTPEELFREAGYSIMEIEKFYNDVHDAIKQGRVRESIIPGDNKQKILTTNANQG